MPYDRVTGLNATEYQSTQHDAWTRTYKDAALWEWLVGQKRK